MKTNFHTHTTFCDGAGTAEQMVVSAIEKGFGALGFSSHSDMVKDLDAYKAEIRRLAAKYEGKIRISSAETSTMSSARRTTSPHPTAVALRSTPRTTGS